MASNMRFELTKREKLRKNRDFQNIYSNGISVANKLLVLHLLQVEKSENRVGFAAGRRLGTAVIRNRVKRLLRESYRHYKDALPKGYDCVLVGRNPAVHRGLLEIGQAFQKLCIKAEQITDSKSKTL